MLQPPGYQALWDPGSLPEVKTSCRPLATLAPSSWVCISLLRVAPGLISGRADSKEPGCREQCQQLGVLCEHALCLGKEARAICRNGF